MEVYKKTKWRQNMGVIGVCTYWKSMNILKRIILRTTRGIDGINYMKCWTRVFLSAKTFYIVLCGRVSQLHKGKLIIWNAQNLIREVKLPDYPTSFSSKVLPSYLIQSPFLSLRYHWPTSAFLSCNTWNILFDVLYNHSLENLHGFHCSFVCTLHFATMATKNPAK